MPIACNSGCCITGAVAAGGEDTCADAGLCSPGASAELDCEDSSQCASGSLCCPGFNPQSATRPAVTGTCVAASSCNGFEICRTDSTTVCSSGTCTAAPTGPSSDWTVFLPGQVGFCSVPTCVAPNDGFGCGSNSQCCSGNCDRTNDQHMNLCY